jgi:hypothetical protein
MNTPSFVVHWTERMISGHRKYPPTELVRAPCCGWATLPAKDAEEARAKWVAMFPRARVVRVGEKLA